MLWSACANYVYTPLKRIRQKSFLLNILTQTKIHIWYATFFTDALCNLCNLYVTLATYRFLYESSSGLKYYTYNIKLHIYTTFAKLNISVVVCYLPTYTRNLQQLVTQAHVNQIVATDHQLTAATLRNNSIYTNQTMPMYLLNR